MKGPFVVCTIPSVNVVVHLIFIVLVGDLHMTNTVWPSIGRQVSVLLQVEEAIKLCSVKYAVVVQVKLLEEHEALLETISLNKELHTEKKLINA